MIIIRAYSNPVVLAFCTKGGLDSNTAQGGEDELELGVCIFFG